MPSPRGKGNRRSLKTGSRLLNHRHSDLRYRSQWRVTGDWKRRASLSAWASFCCGCGWRGRMVLPCGCM